MFFVQVICDEIFPYFDEHTCSHTTYPLIGEQ